MARSGTPFYTTTQRPQPSTDTTLKVLKVETHKKSQRTMKPGHWSLLFCMHCSFEWSDLPDIRISLFVLQLLLLLAQNPFLSSIIISLFLKGALSPSQSFLGSGKGTGLRPGHSRRSFSLVSAIHAGKGTGLISETYIGITGNEKSSFFG